MPPKDIVVFDTETIPDANLHTGDPDDFPKTLFHQVVAISFLAAHLEPTDSGPFFAVDELRSGGDVTYSEAQLIRGFFGLIEKKKPRLITYNGRGFDLPLIKYRGLKYGVVAPWFASGEGRFESYIYRYSVDFHFDLMDALTDFGASRPSPSVKEVCALLGVPAKLGVDGSQVKALVASGRLSEVRDYCETDVLATYLIFLRFALFRGEISPRGHELSVANLRGYLTAERTARPHLGLFLDQWAALSQIHHEDTK
jgi:predicted PolB exonuclease-like 3'-5' exonuclease